MHITVTGRQWFWEYEYTDDEFFTANEMHIPVGRPISMNVTAPADGVIHSFWVPELNGKKDAVPGRNEFLKFEADEPGTYLGQCAEYCGLSHADMRLRVIAQTEDDYDAWVAQQKQPLDARAARVRRRDPQHASGAARLSLARTGVGGRSGDRAEPHPRRRPHDLRGRHLRRRTPRTSRSGSTTRRA